jgi:phage-related minor tail protein
MASKRIRGITIDIDGNVTKLSKALEDVDKSSAKTSAALKDVNRLLKIDPKNTELIAQ